MVTTDRRTEASGISSMGRTHTSVAILDALQAVEVPIIECIYQIFLPAKNSVIIPMSGVAAGVIYVGRRAMHGNRRAGGAFGIRGSATKVPTIKPFRIGRIADETGLTEIEVETGDCELKWRGGTAVAPCAGCGRAAPAEAAPAKRSCRNARQIIRVAKTNGRHCCWHLSRAANFVKVGDTVSEGQTILIDEAMKT